MLAALVTASVFGATVATPTIIGDASDERCMEARNLATSAFKSTSASLVWPIPSPTRHDTKIILHRSGDDISGGDGVSVDPAHFAKLKVDSAWRINWGTNTTGQRLVIVERGHGWRGGTYAVYLIDNAIPQENVVAQVTAEGSGADVTLKPAMDQSWNPPLVLRSEKHGTWFIEVGEPYEVMADWRVYKISENGPSMPCRVSFGYFSNEGPDRIHNALDRMPPAVGKFAAIVDEALGPEISEGTLRPTARIRLKVATDWANAALRPWAVTDEPYNSRAEVDRGLAAWARPNRQRAALRRRMIQAYGSAQRALVFYYASRFKVDPSDARRLSRHVVDHMLRSHFIFSKASPPPAERVHDPEEHESLPREM